MITTVSSAAALQTALAAAHGGDTILLAAGTYSNISISGKNFAQDVTIGSASTTHEALLTGLTVTSSSGLNFRDLEVKLSPSSDKLIIAGSHDIDLTRLNVHGSLDGDPQNDTAGLLVRSSVNVTVTNSEFHELSNGISHLDDSHLTISGNRIHDISQDGIHGGGSSYVTISNNMFTDFHPTPGVHPDAIQFWTTGTDASAHDIVITGNQITRGAGEKAQGIFIGDETSHLPYQHLTISNNLVAGSMYNGIAVSHAEDVTITRNIVAGFSDMKAWILMQNITGATETDNFADQFSNNTNTGVISARNTIIPLATDGGVGALAQWTAQQGATTIFKAAETFDTNATTTSSAMSDLGTATHDTATVTYSDIHAEDFAAQMIPTFGDHWLMA